MEHPDGLSDLGPRLRKRRFALHMTLAELAEKTGLTASSISQLERGKTTGSIKTLRALAQGLGIGFSDLFSNAQDERNEVVDLRKITTQKYGSLAQKALLSPKWFDHMQVFVGFLKPGGSTGEEAFAHGSSEEMIVVLEGSVEVTIGDETVLLTQEQSVAFRSSESHKVKEAAGAPASLLWIIAPPTV